VRQPEVAPLARFLLALVLVVPVVQAGSTALWAGAFLVEFLSDGQHRPLTALTRRPSSTPFPLERFVADRFAPGGLLRGRPAVLVHGLAPQGKNDPRARRAARLLARAGFDVVLPTVPGLTQGRLRPDDAAPVVAALAARRAPTVVVGVSVGSGPALLAATDARVRDRVRTVVSLGGYASARELLRYHLSGTYAFGDVRGRVPVDLETVTPFLDANAELLDASTRDALATRDPDRIDAALDALPEETQHLLGALSPVRVAAGLRARLVLIHGRADRAVPYTESLRLAAARPESTRLVLVGLLDHVEASPGRAGRISELLALWSVMYELLASG